MIPESTSGDPRVESRRVIMEMGDKSGVFVIFKECLKKVSLYSLIAVLEEHGYSQ